MIRNYFVVAIRNLTRNRFFSAINIFGLAVSMTICMAIMMLIADQLQYDRYNSNFDRIYRVNTYPVDHQGNPNGGHESATSPLPLRDQLNKSYTGIEKVVRLKRGFGNAWLEFEDQDVNVPLAGFYADPEVLEFFEYDLEFGNSAIALTEPYSVVLTRAAADKLFSERNPLGQTIKVGELGTYTVTGVIKETSNKSHIVFEGLASMSTITTGGVNDQIRNNSNDWMDFWNGWNYILLEEGKSATDLEKSLAEIYDTHIAPVGAEDQYRAKFRLQPLAEITPGKLLNNPIGPSLPWVFAYFLGGIALIIMLTSCFNFTNLSIARSLKRAKEIGVRKVTGAARFQIFSQFLIESVVIAFCALILAMIMLAFTKPLMLHLNLARILRWDLEANYMVFAVFVAFALVVGTLAGLFPAVVLSGFQPIKVLKQATSLKLFSRVGLRKTLLVTQFTVSLLFILTAIVTYNQLKLFVTNDYGFTMKHNIMIRLNNTSAETLKSELSKFANIESIACASHVPAAGVSYGDDFKKDIADKEWLGMAYFNVDEGYIDNMELQLVAGNSFQAALGQANKNFIIINEQALKVFNFKTASDALGQQLYSKRDSIARTIVGVVKDYNHASLFERIEPMALIYNPDEFHLVQARYTGNPKEAYATVQQAWNHVNPGLKIDQKEIESEIRYFYDTIFGDLVSVLGVMASLAIMISCLGLLGMATYTIESKVKEISIRKILGSSNTQLVYFLSKGFFVLLCVSIVIGVPLAWLINNLWLEMIAYHTSMNLTAILTGVVILTLLGVVTIGSQTLRAAFTNPVDNLKNE